MRLKTRWLFVFIAFSLLLLTYLYLGRMAMQFEFHPPKVNVESDSKSLLRKEIHVIPLNPNVVAPVIANPVALDQINDKTVYLNNAKVIFGYDCLMNRRRLHIFVQSLKKRMFHIMYMLFIIHGMHLKM